MSKTCQFHGCQTALYPKNSTGVCQSHRHARGVCGCAACREAARPKVPRIAQREDVRSADIPVCGVSLGGEAKSVRVSLAREPWG